MRSRHSGFCQVHQASPTIPPVEPRRTSLLSRREAVGGWQRGVIEGRVVAVISLRARGSMRMYLVAGIAGVLVNIACATAQTPEPKPTPEQMESLISQQRLTNQLLLRILETLVV